MLGLAITILTFVYRLCSMIEITIAHRERRHFSTVLHHQSLIDVEARKQRNLVAPYACNVSEWDAKTTGEAS